LWFIYFIIAVTTASSIIVLELLKSKKNTTVTFTEFLKIGALVARV
jgi:Na+/H+ antiporter NhaD/arsenite permease-like protein